MRASMLAKQARLEELVALNDSAVAEIATRESELLASDCMLRTARRRERVAEIAAIASVGSLIAGGTVLALKTRVEWR